MSILQIYHTKKAITEALQTHTTGATSHISPMHSQNKIYTVFVLLYSFTLLIHSPTTFRAPLSNNPINPSSGFFPSPSDTSPTPNAAVVATSPDATVYVHRPDRRAFALFLPSGEEYYIIHPTQSVHDSTTCSRLWEYSAAMGVNTPCNSSLPSLREHIGTRNALATTGRTLRSIPSRWCTTSLIEMLSYRSHTLLI